MAAKLDAEAFLRGRDAYVKGTPLFEFIGAVIAAEAASGEDISMSLALGFADGVLADLRDAGRNAREEMDQR